MAVGGGYRVATLVPQLRATRCLILWGRQDRVLPAKDALGQFARALPDATFRWVEDCGHVPHLEQPRVTVDAIAAFLRGQPVDGDADISAVLAASASDPLAQLNAFLDRPLLDTNVRGGPLEPFKRFARSEPEAAQVLASVVVVGAFLLVARVAVEVARSL